MGPITGFSTRVIEKEWGLVVVDIMLTRRYLSPPLPYSGHIFRCFRFVIVSMGPILGRNSSASTAGRVSLQNLKRRSPLMSSASKIKNSIYNQSNAPKHSQSYHR